jgi:hypothetical protein
MLLGGGVDFCRPLDLFRVLLLGIHASLCYASG